MGSGIYWGNIFVLVADMVVDMVVGSFLSSQDLRDDYYCTVAVRIYQWVYLENEL